MSTTVSSLFNDLAKSLDAADANLSEPAQVAPPSDGISLLDAKNDLFLSYLHNLVFLIILKIRSARADDDASISGISEEVVKKLVENRLYLEKGVKPLEDRLRYQIERIVGAAEDADNAKAQPDGKSGKHKKAPKNRNGSDESSDGDENESGKQFDPLSHRPNPAAFQRPAAGARTQTKPSDGLYKPPKITATVMPVTEKTERATKPQRSAHIDEYIENEMSIAPVAQPSIGSTIVRGGRRHKSSKERSDERERTDYEETNFVRLPAPSKKEKRGQGRKDSGWGGEEWRELGAGADRIGHLLKRRDGALEKSRKRDRADNFSAAIVGERFEKKRKLLERRRNSRVG